MSQVLSYWPFFLSTMFTSKSVSRDSCSSCEGPLMKLSIPVRLLWLKLSLSSDAYGRRTLLSKPLLLLAEMAQLYNSNFSSFWRRDVAGSSSLHKPVMPMGLHERSISRSSRTFRHVAMTEHS